MYTPQPIESPPTEMTDTVESLLSIQAMLLQMILCTSFYEYVNNSTEQIFFPDIIYLFKT